MNKNSKSVKHAKAVLKYWNKPFCTCLLKYIEELEKKAKAVVGWNANCIVDDIKSIVSGDYDEFCDDF